MKDRELIDVLIDMSTTKEYRISKAILRARSIINLTKPCQLNQK